MTDAFGEQVQRLVGLVGIFLGVVAHQHCAQRLFVAHARRPVAGAGHVGDEGGPEAVVVAFHQAFEVALVVRLEEAFPAAVPLFRAGLIRNGAQIPRQAAGVGHGVHADAALLCHAGFGGKILAGAFEEQRVVGAAHMHVARQEEVFEHFVGGLQGNVGGNGVEQLHAGFLIGPAPVIGPENEVHIRLVFADDIAHHDDPFRIVLAGIPAGRALVLRIELRMLAHHAVIIGHDMIVLAGEFAGFAHQNDALEARAALEQAAIGALIMSGGVRIIRMLFADEVAVGVHVDAEAGGAADQVVEIHIAEGRLVHVLDEDQNGVDAGMGDGAQMLLRIHVQTVAGVNHAGSEQRLAVPAAFLDDRAGERVHAGFDFAAALNGSAAGAAGHDDAAVFNHQPVRSQLFGGRSELGQIFAGGHDDFAGGRGSLGLDVCALFHQQVHVHGIAEVFHQVIGGVLHQFIRVCRIENDEILGNNQTFMLFPDVFIAHTGLVDHAQAFSELIIDFCHDVHLITL